MPAIIRVPLGGETLNRKWFLDVNAATHAAPNWIGVFGISDFKPAIDPTLQDDSDFDSSGYKSSVATAVGWKLDFKVERKTTVAVPTIYDPGQEILRGASPLMGIGNQVEVRWYEMTAGGPKVEAYQGYAVVSWSDDGGGMEAKSTASVSLTGRGIRTVIVHPDGAAAVPVLYSITPAAGAAAGSQLAVIRGSGFFLNGVDNVTATTGVKFTAVNATRWIVVSDNEIVVVVPAVAAGASNVTVTNAVGVSTTALNYQFS